MKKKYKIVINPATLSKEQIARHKDFDALLRRYRHLSPKTGPIYRRLSFWVASVAVAAGLALLLVYTGMHRPTYEQQMAAHFLNRPFIAPPLAHIKSTFVSQKVSANEGGVIEYPSGSRLIVPPAAFANGVGVPVEGEVTIQYREMHDFVDFFLSGIPMSYDSAGVQYTLESAGMVEIFAEQNGKRVNLAPGKSIAVELVSRVNVSPTLHVPPGYNIYKLDEEKRNWVYQEVDNMDWIDDRLPLEQPDKNSPLNVAKKELNQRLQAIEVSKENELASVEASLPKPKKPVRPIKVNTDDYVFDLNFNDLKVAHPTGEMAATQKELTRMYRQYEKMLWQLSPDAGISPEQLQKGFSNVSDIAIRKLDNRTYELTLKKGTESLKVKVNPVLSGADYEMALTEFNRDFQRFQREIKQRETALKAQKEAIIKKYEKEKRLANLQYEEHIAALRKEGMDYEATKQIISRRVVNRFRATGFGIWNCDRPIPPDVLQLTATFKDENGRPYKNRTAYKVDKTRNTVVQFLAEDGARISFNLSAENLLWLITDDNKIAVFRPEDFKALKKGMESYDFVLEKIDREIKDEKDVREILYL